MRMETKTKVEEETSRSHASVAQSVFKGLRLCTGDVEHLDKYVGGKKTPTSCCYF